MDQKQIRTLKGRTKDNAQKSDVTRKPRLEIFSSQRIKNIN